MKSQTATEYLIILAVVIVIAMIVIGVLGGIPSIGGGAGKQSSSVKLMTAKIGVMNHDLSNESLKLILRNNLAESMSLSSLTIEKTICSAVNIPSILRSGQKKTFICTNINSNATGTQYEYDLAINYTDVATQAQYTLDGLELVGVVSGLAGSGSESLASGFTGWCYQETANASHASDGDCDLDYEGSYDPYFRDPDWYEWDSINHENLTYDGNWSTYGRPITDASIEDLIVNYTRPLGATNESLIQIKTKSDTVRNISIPDSCQDQPILSMRYELFPWDSKVYIYCFNGSSYQYIPDSEWGYMLYEDAVWWNIE